MSFPIITSETEARSLTNSDVMARAVADPKHPVDVEPDQLEFLRAPDENVNLETAEKALSRLNPDMAYPEWLEIAMALRHQFPGEPQASKAYQLFDKWSSKGIKYRGPQETQAKWRSVQVSPRGRAPITIRTLIRRAAEATDDRSLPPIVPASEIFAHPPKRPDELVEGILFKGRKLIIGAPSKARKTWTNLDLAVSVATGARWLGHKTKAAVVLYLDFELGDYEFYRRLEEVVTAKCAEQDLPVFRWGLRGYTLNLGTLLPKIRQFCLEKKVGLIVIDPLYAALEGRDENSNSDMASLMLGLEKIAQETKAAIAIVHHFAKGNSSGKDAQDRMSGAGALARAADAMLIMTPHKDDTDEDPVIVAEFIARSFRKPPAVVLRWRHPCWITDAAADTTQLKGSRRGRTPEYDPTDLLGILGNRSLTWSDFQRKAETQQSVSRSTFRRLLKQAEKAAPS